MQFIAAFYDCYSTCPRFRDGAVTLLDLASEYIATAVEHAVPTGSKPLPATASCLHVLHVIGVIRVVMPSGVSMYASN